MTRDDHDYSADDYATAKADIDRIVDADLDTLRSDPSLDPTVQAFLAAGAAAPVDERTNDEIDQAIRDRTVGLHVADELLAAGQPVAYIDHDDNLVWIDPDPT